jgi:hypothetical protein
MHRIGRAVVALAAAWLPAAWAQEGATVKSETPTGATQLCIEGVDRYRVCEPLYECVRVVLAKRGESYTPEYIQGISGAAFRTAGICPCAPTCSAAMQTEALVELLGYKARRVNLDDKGAIKVKDLADAMQANGKVLPEEAKLASPELRELRRELLAILDAVKAEVRAGRPAIVWHAFTSAEYDVVVGFDDAKGTFLGRGSYAGGGADLARAPQTRTLTAVYVGGPPGDILVGEKQSTFDAPKAEVAALQEAVRHAHSAKNRNQVGKEPWVFLEGLSAYDQWIRHFSDAGATRGVGDAYCYGIYRETHGAAAGFLREIAPRHTLAQTLLVEAAGHFQAEADVLKGAEGLLWWNSPDGPDAARNQRAAEVLTKARTEYAAGIEAIGRGLTALGEAVEVPAPAQE